MDAHTHLTSDFSGNYNERRLRMLDENISQLALEMIPNAKATIEAGFTSVAMSGAVSQIRMISPTSRFATQSTKA
jgi:hypothetical protein